MLGVNGGSGGGGWNLITEGSFNVTQQPDFSQSLAGFIMSRRPAHTNYTQDRRYTYVIVNYW